MDHGCTPDEALQEWDIYPYDGKNNVCLTTRAGCTAIA